MVLFTSSIFPSRYESFSPIDYVQSKITENDIVFLGTRHRQPEILYFFTDLIPTLKNLGITHIGLEIPSDEQDAIDQYISSGNGHSNIQVHTQIDCPEYRKLFQALKKADGPKPVAIDLPYSEYDGNISRDEWMARSLLKVFEQDPSAKILVKVGNLHIFKKLQWQNQLFTNHLSIREYIHRQRPHVKMVSIGQVIDESVKDCDFSKHFGSIHGSVAIDLDERYKGWNLGMTSNIAIEPAECFELLDGLIIY